MCSINPCATGLARILRLDAASLVLLTNTRADRRIRVDHDPSISSSPYFLASHLSVLFCAVANDSCRHIRRPRISTAAVCRRSALRSMRQTFKGRQQAMHTALECVHEPVAPHHVQGHFSDMIEHDPSPQTYKCFSCRRQIGKSTRLATNPEWRCMQCCADQSHEQ